MKLYYAPGACSLAPHIVLREANFEFELEKVDLAAKRTESGKDYLKINPKGYVPALQTKDGEVITEAAVILQYLSDKKPKAHLAPKHGSMERYRLLEWLNFTASEIHKTLGALFKPEMTPEWRKAQIAYFYRRLEYLAKHLHRRKFLLGDEFSIADAYLFTVLNWVNLFKIDISDWPEVKKYMIRISERPSVQEAMAAEGLSKKAA